ncbi:hypothetical protein [Solihabitans fulvus]|uniref:hypothetical protein n=1 Tax=Solihabitans fulvus TaxID=1892852 RepID=UPI0016621B7F|nr:hypothetical protein [Solihabitans fulvus]
MSPSIQRVAMASVGRSSGTPGAARSGIILHQVAALVVPDTRDVDETSGCGLVARSDIQLIGQFVVVDRDPGVGDARGHELVRSSICADDAGLRGDELGGLARLEGTPRDVVVTR